MGAIPTQTIEQIAAANDIVEVIASYFPLKRAGANLKALCPFHQEKTPSFHVSPQRQTFHCFGCGAGGTVFRFVMDYEHVDFPSAVRKLGARAGIPIIEEWRGQEESGQHQTRRMLLQLHAEAAEWFHINLLKRDFAAAARAYLKDRGLDQQIANRWQLGYAPADWDAFLKWALQRGYNRAQILQSGLVKLRDENQPNSDFFDRFRSRIMFPICNDVGEVIAFSGRVLNGDGQTAKYINSPETPLFRKGNILFGLHKTKRSLIDANCAIICEGQLDLITLFEAGITNVVAPQGTAFTDNQARTLKRYVNEVVLCFDADAAGKKAAERSLEPLLQNDVVVRVAEMPAGEDPDSLIRHNGRQDFENRIAAARGFFEYWIDREVSGTDLTSLTAKLELARRLAESVSRIQNPIARGEISHRVTVRVGLAPADFESLLEAQNRQPTQVAERPLPRAAAAPPHNVAMLCLFTLRDERCRKFLLEQNWREVLAQTPNSDLLVRILQGEFNPSDTGSLNAFMATLTPAEESLVSSWLLQKLPPNADVVIEQWWRGLHQAALRRQLQVAESRIKRPQLSTGEVVNLQKQILDLRKQLHELPEFSSTPAHDR